MRLTGKIFILAGIMAAMFLALALFFELDVARRNPSQTFTVMRGQNAFQIANDLKAEGYIKSKIVFLVKVAGGGNLRQLKAGEYDLRGDSLDKIIGKLVVGQTVASETTIIPGWDIRDIAAALGKGKIISGADFYEEVSAVSVVKLKDKYPFLASIPADSDLEGFLAPDTYQLAANSDAAGFVTVALDNFSRNLTSQIQDDIAAQKRSVFDIVTMASMLEKEVKTLDDKKIVSGILWKRLGAGMPLQVDSTLLYYKISGTGGSVIDKDADSPYNTYRFAGLPAGPICNPGRESIIAATYPQDSGYWYYLSAKDGTTIFSRNYGEHLINKAKYIDNL
jgi:UPF0755 protein